MVPALRVMDSDPVYPGWDDYVVIVLMVLILAAVFGWRVYRGRPVRRTVETNVKRLDEHDRFITGGGPLTDRVMMLEDQLAVERKYRSVLEAAVLAAFDAAEQPVPVALAAQTTPPPKLTVIRGGAA